MASHSRYWWTQREHWNMPLFMKAWLQFEGPERRKKSSGFWPRWALSWPESGIAALATLVSGLGCLHVVEFVSSADILPNTSVGRVWGFKQRDLEIHYFETTPRDPFLGIVCLYIYICICSGLKHRMGSWYWRIDLCTYCLNIFYICVYIYVYIYIITHILSTQQTPTLKTAHPLYVIS